MNVAAHWIGSEWLPAGSRQMHESLSPADGTLVGSVPRGGRAEAEAAIDTAVAAFAGTAWPQSPRLRAEVLFEAADRIAAEAPRIADLLSRETGKLLWVARLELASVVSEIRYYAGLVRALSGRVIEADPGIYSLLLREPAGVAGIIVPWNAPGILLVRSLAPALAAGCSVVVKPALQSSLFNTEVLACFREVKALPEGIVNSFCEAGSEGAQELVRSPKVDVLSFTGSSAVGKRIMADAAPTLKRLNLELGGKAPAVVFDDCDLEAIAPRIAAGATILCGQQCTAINRILVQESVFEKAKTIFASALAGLKVGRIDRDDWIHVVDRIKDLIKVKGYQVAPAELEAVLIQHPGVADAAVTRALVDGEERPVGYIVSRGDIDPDAVATWLADRVAPYKRLAAIHAVKQLPRTPSGKLLRRALPTTVTP